MRGKISMGICCPHCGSTMPDALVGLSEAVSFVSGPRQRSIFEALKARPRTVEQLVSDVYGLDIDGGPEAPINTVHVLLARLRAQLWPLGWTIKASGYPKIYTLIPEGNPQLGNNTAVKKQAKGRLSQGKNPILKAFSVFP